MRCLHTLASPQERHPGRGTPWHSTGKAAPSVPLDTWPWPEHVLQMAAPFPPTPKPGFKAFSPSKNYGFYILKLLLCFHLSACRAGVPTLRPSSWLSGQDALPAADIPQFAGNLHIPSTCGQGSLGTSLQERSLWHPLCEEREGGFTFPGEQGWRALGAAPVCPEISTQL